MTTDSMLAPAPRRETTDILRALVGFDTTSYRSNLQLIDYVYEYLKGLGIEAFLDFNDEQTKANLYAVIGPGDGGGIALSGHTDVVPVQGQNWSRDPWSLTEDRGRFYGRGTTDMKGFIAAALAAVPDMLAVELQKPIHLCLSYDEEIGCLGVRSLLEYLSRQETRPEACLVGEPTSMKVINGHKGKLSMRCRVKGHACHSSLAPKGVNAVEAAAKVITYMSGMAKRKQEEGPFDADFDVPHTTVHTGVIQGGTQVNIVPEECEFQFEFRNIPQENPHSLLAMVHQFAHQKIEPSMKAINPETGFVWEQQSEFPGLDTDPDADVVVLAKELCGYRQTGKVAFGTEAGGFSRIGVSSVVCGPGSIDQAHKPDEFVTLDQLAQCDSFIEKLIARLSHS